MRTEDLDETTIKPPLSPRLGCAAAVSALALVILTSAWLLSYWHLAWDFPGRQCHVFVWQGILEFAYSHKAADSSEIPLTNTFGSFRYFALRWLPTYVHTARGWSMHLPIWIAVLPFAIAPTLYIVRGNQADRRRRRGLCMACGYDVRWSGSKCPECGSRVSPPAARARTDLTTRFSWAALGYLALFCAILVALLVAGAD